MSYAIKYQMQMTNKAGDTYLVNLLGRDFIGQSQWRNFGSSGLVFRKDINERIHGTSCEFSIEVNKTEVFGLEDLYSDDPKGNRVDVYKNGSFYWTGFLQPLVYSDPYIYPEFDVELTATDGLGNLKNEDFGLTGYQTLHNIISHCLAKTGLVIGVAYNVQIHEERHNSLLPPFTQTGIDASVIGYDDKGNPLDCLEVIDKIVRSFDESMVVTQDEGLWKIFRPVDYASEFTEVAFGGQCDAYGIFPITEMGSPDSADVYPDGQLLRAFLPAIKKATLTQDYGLRANLHPYGEFAEGDFEKELIGGVYWRGVYVNTKWTDKDDGDKIRGELDTFRSGDKIGTMRVSELASSFRYLSNSDLYLKQEDELIKFSFGYSFSSFPAGTCTARIKIKIGAKWLGENGWQDSEYAFEFSNSAGSSGTVTMYAESIPEDGYLSVYVSNAQGQYTNRINTIAYDYIALNYAASISSGKEVSVLVNSNNNKKTPLKVLGDVPDFENTRAACGAGLLLSEIDITQRWRHMGDTEDWYLTGILARTIASNNRTVRQQLSGVLIGSVPGVTGIVRHALNDNRKFLITDAAYDVFENSLECTLVELLDYQETTFTTDEKQVLSNAQKAATTVNADKDYVVYGSGVGTGLRPSALPTIADADETWSVLIDKAGQESAGKVPYVSPVAKTLFDTMFELIPNNGNPYIRAKLSLASDGELMAYANDGNLPPSIWESLPYATAESFGVVKAGANITIVGGVISVDGAVGTGFDEAAGYNPSGPWNFTGILNKGGQAVATEAYVVAGFAAKTHNHDSVYHPIGGNADSDFIAKNLTIHGTVNHWLADVITVEDARLQLNRAQDAATVSSGIDIWDGTSVVSSLLYDTSGRWKIGGQNIATEDWIGNTAIAYNASRLGGFAAADFLRRNVDEAVTGNYTFNSLAVGWSVNNDRYADRYFKIGYFNLPNLYNNGSATVQLTARYGANHIVKATAERRETNVSQIKEFQVTGNIGNQIYYLVRTSDNVVELWLKNSQKYENMTVAIINHSSNFYPDKTTGQEALPTNEYIWECTNIFNFKADKLGIGTTFPSEKLEVAGKGLFSDKVTVNNSNFNQHFELKRGTGYGSITLSAGGALTLSSLNDFDWTKKIVLDKLGNVGIGASAPTEKLDVDGNIQVSTYQGKIGFNVSDAYNDGKYAHYGLSKLPDGDKFINLAGYYGLTFGTRGLEKMRITQAGNVGIGTTSPTEKLDVNGNIKTSDRFMLSNKWSIGVNETNGDLEFYGEDGTVKYMMSQSEGFHSKDELTAFSTR